MIRNLMKPLYLRLWILPRMHRVYNALSVSETFRRIYLTKAWGDSGEPFCSGLGSRGTASEQYCEFVIKFIQDHNVQSIVDLGCGDFSVGRRIVETCGIRYTGIDVVPELIEHHKITIHDSRVSFQCADIGTDPLPSADLYLIRQVLQHLSNKEIGKVLANVRNFSGMLITEEVPVRPKSFNRDKVHGPDVRSCWGSGVYVDEPPFSMRIAEQWNLPLSGNTTLRTVLIGQSSCGRRGKSGDLD